LDTEQLIKEKGFLDIEFDLSLDLFKEIEHLKKEKKCNYSRSLLPGCRYTRCGGLYR